MAGMYLEDFTVGDVIRHAQTRTVTETDNVLFNSLTMNPQPLHLDAHFAEQSMYGERIVNAVFTLGLVVGIPVYETTLGTTLGHLSYDEITFPAPVVHGDTLRVETEVLDQRVSNSKPDRGIVKLEHRGFNQDGTLICKVVRNALMSRRPETSDA